MIKRPKPERFRLRRTMMFMNAQKPGLIKDAYIYGCDSIMLDLEDAVAENQKDAARFSLYHALTTIDYGNTEVIVRINGLDTPHWQEDIRVCVAGGADGIRIAKCESAQDVKTVEEHVAAAEREFGVEVGRTLLMAALESPKGIMNASRDLHRFRQNAGLRHLRRRLPQVHADQVPERWHRYARRPRPDADGGARGRRAVL